MSWIFTNAGGSHWDKIQVDNHRLDIADSRCNIGTVCSLEDRLEKKYHTEVVNVGLAYNYKKYWESWSSRRFPGDKVKLMRYYNIHLLRNYAVMPDCSKFYHAFIPVLPQFSLRCSHSEKIFENKLHKQKEHFSHKTKTRLTILNTSISWIIISSLQK